MSFSESSDGFGDLSVLGDQRWAGAFGIHADFIAVDNCFLTCISTTEVLVKFTCVLVLLCALLNCAIFQEALRKPNLYRIKEIFKKAEYKPSIEDEFGKIPEEGTLKVRCNFGY